MTSIGDRFLDAVFHDNFIEVNRLLKNIATRTYLKNTKLHLHPLNAANSGLMVERLINYGFSFKKRMPDVEPTTEIYETMLNYGADINACKNGYTALIKSVSLDKIDCVKFLLERGADVNLRCKTMRDGLLWPNCSPLMKAVLTQNVEIVKLLLERPEINYDLEYECVLYMLSRGEDCDERIVKLFENKIFIETLTSIKRDYRSVYETEDVLKHMYDFL